MGGQKPVHSVHADLSGMKLFDYLVHRYLCTSVHLCAPYDFIGIWRLLYTIWRVELRIVSRA